jgi:hypothetical protein
MRSGFLALVALLMVGTAALAEDAAEEEAEVDSWIGCWNRIYDAVHLAKHPAQKVAALTRQDHRARTRQAGHLRQSR